MPIVSDIRDSEDIVVKSIRHEILVDSSVSLKSILNLYNFLGPKKIGLQRLDESLEEVDNDDGVFLISYLKVKYFKKDLFLINQMLSKHIIFQWPVPGDVKNWKYRTQMFQLLGELEHIDVWRHGKAKLRIANISNKQKWVKTLSQAFSLDNELNTSKLAALVARLSKAQQSSKDLEDYFRSHSSIVTTSDNPLFVRYNFVPSPVKGAKRDVLDAVRELGCADLDSIFNWMYMNKGTSFYTIRDAVYNNPCLERTGLKKSYKFRLINSKS